jgi:hypothetical protein
VARPEKQRLASMEEALARLKDDPTHPIRVVVDGMEIELRRPANTNVIPGVADQAQLGDRMAEIGPWQGESTEEIVQILRDNRAGRGKLPDLL